MALGTITLKGKEYKHGEPNVTNLRGLDVGDQMVISNKCIPHGIDAEFSQTGIDSIFADDYSLVSKANGCWADSMHNSVPDSAENKKAGNKLLIERKKISDSVKAMYCQVNKDSPICAAAPGAGDDSDDDDDSLDSDNDDDKDSDGKILGMDQTTVIIAAIGLLLLVMLTKN